MVLRHKIKASKEASSCLNSIGNPLPWLSSLSICPATKDGFSIISEDEKFLTPLTRNGLIM